MTEKPRIVAVINGGVLQCVYASNPDLDVTVIDYDDLRDSGKDIGECDKLESEAAHNLTVVF